MGNISSSAWFEFDCKSKFMNLFNLFAGKYLFSFAVEGNLKFTKDDVTTLQSVFYFCHLSSRFSGIIIARFLHISNMSYLGMLQDH